MQGLLSRYTFGLWSIDIWCTFGRTIWIDAFRQFFVSVDCGRLIDYNIHYVVNNLLLTKLFGGAFVRIIGANGFEYFPTWKWLFVVGSITIQFIDHNDFVFG